MQNQNEKLISFLFQTDAIRVCPQDKPFWYTSGTIGPYYINTHFLYGSEEKANNLLKLIDEEKNDYLQCIRKVSDEVEKNYREDTIYKSLIDDMVDFIRQNINVDEVDMISGGERRDWFFSVKVANILNKPHVTIYKDLQTCLIDGDKVLQKDMAKGKNILHIADLITEASSYVRAWIPAVKGLDARIKWSCVVVDRMQGGGQLLEKEGIKSLSMIQVDKELFRRACSMNLINEQQYRMVSDYIDDPKASMKAFLDTHPDFIEETIARGGKDAQRAKLCLESDIYGLKK